MLHVVKMTQVSRYRWNLVAPKGHILVEGVLAASKHHAENWVKSFISSHPCWTYVIISKEGT